MDGNGNCYFYLLLCCHSQASLSKRSLMLIREEKPGGGLGLVCSLETGSCIVVLW